MFSVIVHPKAEKELLRIPKKIRLNILGSILGLKSATHPLKYKNVIKLKGATLRYRLRVGDYRVKLEWRKPDLLLVYEVEHRQAGY